MPDDSRGPPAKRDDAARAASHHDAAPQYLPAVPRKLTLAERADMPCNDRANALRLFHAHGERLLYVHGRGWGVWDGCRFDFSQGEIDVVELTECLEAMAKEEAEELEARQGHDAKKARLADAVRMGNLPTATRALARLKGKVDADMAALDAEPLHLVTPNGTVDLFAAYRWERPEGCTDEEEAAARAAWLISTDRSTRPTRVTGAAYDAAADCPGWRAFLELVMPDAKERAALQRLLGYCLSGDNPEAACIVLRGPGGNGKSTLLTTLRHVLGQRHGYAEGCNIEMFIQTPPRPQNAHNSDEIDLPGARIYIATEPDARDVLDMKKVKSLTGGDVRKSRGAYEKASFAWVPRGVPILAVNRTPKLKDGDAGTRRRLIFVPLEVNLKELPPEKRRPAYEVEAELRGEASGILNWLVDGWRDYKAQGLALPEKWLALRDELLLGADPVARFLGEMTETAEDGRVLRSEFNAVFATWAVEEGAAAWSSKAVGEGMTELGRKARKIGGIHYYLGLRWTEGAMQTVERVRAQTPARPATEPAADGDQPPPF